MKCFKGRNKVVMIDYYGSVIIHYSSIGIVRRTPSNHADNSVRRRAAEKYIKQLDRNGFDLEEISAKEYMDISSEYDNRLHRDVRESFHGGITVGELMAKLERANPNALVNVFVDNTNDTEEVETSDFKEIVSYAPLMHERATLENAAEIVLSFYADED